MLHPHVAGASDMFEHFVTIVICRISARTFSLWMGQSALQSRVLHGNKFQGPQLLIRAGVHVMPVVDDARFARTIVETIDVRSLHYGSLRVGITE